MVNSIARFKNYNFTNFISQSEELALVQARQREAQMVKVQHMQEFVDKFRYNAKRASLVQSRIKTLEKETIIEEVEVEAKFQFYFPRALNSVMDTICMAARDTRSTLPPN